jgi:DNA-binding NarL/FixJ family response regulator
VSTPEAQSLSVLIVDDRPIMRVGVASILTGSGFTVIAQAGTGTDAIRLHRELHPDLTLMDLRLPDISGIEAIQKIRSQDPAAKIVVLTTYEGDEDIHQAIGAGAGGYLIKGMSHNLLLKALHQVHRGSRFLPQAVIETLQSRIPTSHLSQREREVLQLMFEGMSNKEIADALQIKEATVKSHVSVILMRLDVTDRTQAVVAGLKRGLVHL